MYKVGDEANLNWWCTQATAFPIPIPNAHADSQQPSRRSTISQSCHEKQNKSTLMKHSWSMHFTKQAYKHPCTLPSGYISTKESFLSWEWPSSRHGKALIVFGFKSSHNIPASHPKKGEKTHDLIDSPGVFFSSYRKWFETPKWPKFNFPNCSSAGSLRSIHVHVLLLAASWSRSRSSQATSVMLK